MADSELNLFIRFPARAQSSIQRRRFDRDADGRHKARHGWFYACPGRCGNEFWVPDDLADINQARDEVAKHAQECPGNTRPTKMLGHTHTLGIYDEAAEWAERKTDG